jgi:hypothetical protein
MKFIAVVEGSFAPVLNCKHLYKSLLKWMTHFIGDSSFDSNAGGGDPFYRPDRGGRKVRGEVSITREICD